MIINTTRLPIVRNTFLFIVLTFSYAFQVVAQSQDMPSIKALHAHAVQKGVSPKEYIFKLFEQSDIVVLGERDHRDTVQYNFILDLLADSRFAERVGYVYTEVGAVNMTDEANRLLQGTYAAESDFTDSIYTYYRKGETFYPL